MKCSENRKSMEQLAEENAPLYAFLARKERACDIPTYVISILGVMVILNVYIYMGIDMGAVVLGLSSMVLLTFLGGVQGEKQFYHQVFGEKALEMGCPLRTKYKNRRGTSGWDTYVLVNPMAYKRLLALRYQEQPYEYAEEVVGFRPFVKKYCIEKVSTKKEVGKTISEYEMRKKV